MTRARSGGFMAKKTKRERKRDKREQEAAELEAAEQVATRRRRTMRWIVIAIPLVTLAASGITWAATDDIRMAALVGLLGVGLWVPALLGSIGGAVQPRDRTRAGSIDFGNRR